ncbi:PREDICTED: ATP-dependent RNA helicase p62-like [Papilio xuthus]|uniref:RNA helicase n=1 Tax=Papilio xuthus TaxID=66420 RepID=A0AAJ6ZHC6_PAPXU|nr:PREDICTED: ATP-dependent RNA helicase p62-like [Papilio xuthus]
MALNILPVMFLRRNGIKSLCQSAKYLQKLQENQLYAVKNEIRLYSNKNVKNYIGTLQTKNILHEKKYYSVKTAQQDLDYYNEHNITIIGDNVPSPYRDIENCDFPDYIKTFLKKQGLVKPTIIQSQGWPVALSGKNLVGIAQTGTGKTLAYLLPAVVHIKEKQGRRSKGPRVLVLAPTRELARQIEEVAKEFETLLNVRCLCIHGGANRGPQAAALKEGVDILIATPGRLNDFINSKTTTLTRCTYVVLDEADRMLDMGFEPQIREALEEVPHERQILMFSATWPKEVEHLAKDYLGEFIQVNVGSTELSANHNIQQNFHICEQDEKMEKFKEIMHDISSQGLGKVLVFTNTKRFVDTLALTLRRNGWPAVGIHGDKTQNQRDAIINRFKSGNTNILVATDVAARGLDVDGVTHVINYDFPNTSEDYIHRIGRTGRLQNKGVSHTILTEDDARHAKSLIPVLREANQVVPRELEDMARSYNVTKQKEYQSKYNTKRSYGFNPNKRNNFRSRNSYNRYNRY